LTAARRLTITDKEYDVTASVNDVGDLHLATVVVNVQDMERGVRFWSAALGYEPREERWDSEFMMLVHPEGRGLPVSLQLADTPPKEPVRVHLDLYTDEQQRHVDRLVALGATRVDDWPYPDGADFVVLRDPDGNELCVIDHAAL
jgi:catechol 2,3-dioxygenase-like lactoylglutathione lyase family enzyme